MRVFPISIIIATSGTREHRLRRACLSVRQQEHDAIEIVLVSPDAHRSLRESIRRWSGIDRVVFGSDPGMGVYPAFNIGADAANGEAILFLNDDDELLPNAIDYLASALQGTAFDMASGGAELAEESGAHISVWNQTEIARLELPALLYNPCLINARLIRSKSLAKLLPFREDLKIASDFELLLRASLSGMESLPLDRIVYRYYAHFGSLTMNGVGRHAQRTFLEKIHVFEDLLQTDIPENSRTLLRRRYSEFVTSNIRMLFNDRQWGKMWMQMRDAFAHDSLWMIARLLSGNQNR